MYHLLLRTAHKPFVKITQTNPIIKNSILSLSCRSLCNDYVYCEDTDDYCAEKENVVSWTSRISNLVRKDKPNEAVFVFKSMFLNKQKPNYVTILSLIRALRSLNSEYLNFGIHGLVIKLGFEFEVSVVTALIGIYSVFNMDYVWKLFDTMQVKDAVLCCAMISSCVRNEEYDEALEIFKNMQYNGVESDNVSAVSVLPACSHLGALLYGKQIHGFSIKRMVYCHTNVLNSLVDMYAKCKKFDASIRVFYDIKVKDLISWKTMIRGCIENGFYIEAINVFSMMRCSCFEPNEIIIRDIIGAILEIKELKLRVAFHCYTLKSGILSFITVGTSILQMYANFGEVGPARILFNQLHDKDLIAWTAMISAYAQNNQHFDALNTFKNMLSANEKPNVITFTSVVQSCSSMGNQELGTSIHSHTIKSGYLSNSFLTSSLLDLYCKLGKINLGKSLFDEILIKDLISWSSMINGYGLNGCGNEALEMFSKMLDCGFKPNEIVFLSVLSACSHCGLEQEGWKLFKSMENIFGISPKLPHYACMVDLLSRHGNMEEAFDFVGKMTIKPDKRIWAALLLGCKLRPGNLKIAEIVAKKLIDLDPENTSYYVILSNLYADEERWEDVKRLRNLVDEKGLKKMKGWSVIEAN